MSWYNNIVNREASYMLNHFSVDKETLEVTALSSSGIKFSLGIDPTFVEATGKMVEIAHDIVSDRMKIMDMIMSSNVVDEDDDLPELDQFIIKGDSGEV